MIPVHRLNHAVLYVRDAQAAAQWYSEVFGFEVVTEMAGAAFLRAAGTDNHHDLGLFSVGADAHEHDAAVARLDLDAEVARFA